jgi:hypothetical protein
MSFIAANGSCHLHFPIVPSRLLKVAWSGDSIAFGSHCPDAWRLIIARRVHPAGPKKKQLGQRQTILTVTVTRDRVENTAGGDPMSEQAAVTVTEAKSSDCSYLQKKIRR